MVRVTLVPAIVLGQLLLMLIIYLSFVRNNQKCPEILPPLASKCELSLFESDGYICESDALWNERKRIFHPENERNKIRYPDTFYFLTNWEPTFHCSHARRIGARGDGGKWICDPHRLKARTDCLIYSVGSSGDFSFEIELKKLYARIAELGYNLELSEKAKAFIADKGFDKQFGARPLKRAIQKYVEDALAEEIITSKINSGDLIFMDLDETSQELTVLIKKAEEPAN